MEIIEEIQDGIHIFRPNGRLDSNTYQILVDILLEMYATPDLISTQNEFDNKQKDNELNGTYTHLTRPFLANNHNPLSSLNLCLIDQFFQIPLDARK